jgi:hypothetical protein
LKPEEPIGSEQARIFGHFAHHGFASGGSAVFRLSGNYIRRMISITFKAYDRFREKDVVLRRSHDAERRL